MARAPRRMCTPSEPRRAAPLQQASHSHSVPTCVRTQRSCSAQQRNRFHQLERKPYSDGMRGLAGSAAAYCSSTTPITPCAPPRTLLYSRGSVREKKRGFNRLRFSSGVYFTVITFRQCYILRHMEIREIKSGIIKMRNPWQL